MKQIAIIASALFLISCGGSESKSEDIDAQKVEKGDATKIKEEKYNEQEVNGTYAISVHESMSKAYSLNSEASLQYQNTAKELYIIVIDETKESFGEAVETYGEVNGVSENTFRSYTDFLLEDYKAAFPTEEQPGKEDRTLNGLTSEVYTYYTKFNGLDITLKLAMVDGKDHYYQIMTWTLSKYEDENLDRMNKMIDSFKEM